MIKIKVKKKKKTQKVKEAPKWGSRFWCSWSLQLPQQFKTEENYNQRNKTGRNGETHDDESRITRRETQVVADSSIIILLYLGQRINFCAAKPFNKACRENTRETNKTTSSLLSFSPFLILLIKEVLQQFFSQSKQKVHRATRTFGNINEQTPLIPHSQARAANKGFEQHKRRTFFNKEGRLSPS